MKLFKITAILLLLTTSIGYAMECELIHKNVKVQKGKSYSHTGNIIKCLDQDVICYLRESTAGISCIKKDK